MTQPASSKKLVRELRRVAETLGFENREQVQRVLEAGGLGGAFTASRWKEYVALLVVHAKKTEVLHLRLEEKGYASDHGPCPVCGASTRKSSPRQALFTAKWICEKGGSAHYYQNLVTRMRAQKGLPPLDYLEQDRMLQERRERDELIRGLYWRAVEGDLEQEDLKRFVDAYRQSGWLAG